MTSNVLKLDEVFGLSNPVIVEWKGKRFEMVRPEGLTLEQNKQWNSLSKRLVLNYGPTAKRNVSGDQSAAELDQAMDECLRLLCPAILEEGKPLTLGEKIQRKFHPERFEDWEPLTFNQKFKILEFYAQEVFKRDPSRTNNSGMKGSRKNRTGA